MKGRKMNFCKGLFISNSVYFNVGIMREKASRQCKDSLLLNFSSEEVGGQSFDIIQAVLCEGNLELLIEFSYHPIHFLWSQMALESIDEGHIKCAPFVSFFSFLGKQMDFGAFRELGF